MIDRLTIRERPRGLPIMHQKWAKLLFLHWRIPEELIRPLIPTRLRIDTYDGSAWIGITPFTMWGVRPVLAPPLPILSESHEINVRTYVHLNGVPGVWFFSLDASNALAVWGARRCFHLPYFKARMWLHEEQDLIHYVSERTDSKAPPATFEAQWSVGEKIQEAQPGSLEFFLLERYCLYAARKDRLYRARIFHRPWPLRRAWLNHFTSSMIESHGLPTPEGQPLLHQQSEPLQVRVWPLQKV